jgi:hypothetical protein
MRTPGRRTGQGSPETGKPSSRCRMNAARITGRSVAGNAAISPHAVRAITSVSASLRIVGSKSNLRSSSGMTRGQ